MEPDLCTCFKPGGPDPMFRMECPVHGPTASLAKWKGLVREAVKWLDQSLIVLVLMAVVNHRPAAGDPLRDGIEDFINRPEIKALMGRREGV